MHKLDKLFFLLVVISHNSWAGPESLDLLIREALDKNPLVLQKKSELMVSANELEAAEWGRFPTLGITGQTADSGANNSSVKIEQPLWTGGKLSAQISIAQSAKKSANADLDDTKQQLSKETASYFFEILRLEDRLKIARDNEAQHKILLETISRRTKAKINPEADAVLALSRLNQASTEVFSLKRQIAMARTKLGQLVGRTVEDLIVPPQINFEHKILSEVQNKAISSSSLLDKLSYDRDLAGAEIKLARAQAFPDIVAGYEYNLGDLDSFGQSRGMGYLAMTYQSGAGLSSSSRISAANAKRQALSQSIRSAEMSIKEETESLLSEISVLSEQVLVVRKTTESASMIMESYLRQFQVGKKSWLDVLNVQREKAQSYYQLADVIYPLELAKVKLLILTDEIDYNYLSPNSEAFCCE